ncbi:allophanate hydrolase [Andreprevotia chitinilytica]|uniref:allophanate hydrolase n=1 Tax=Andreprevotia chitinilytica TaxID=396808 RepID=UPI000551ACE9|nr:allophanate hydrolase [Andreprevotia chitinilytica]
MSQNALPIPGWTLADWQRAYRSGQLHVRDALREVLQWSNADDPAWIAYVAEEQFGSQLDAQLAALQVRLAECGGDLVRLPLYGIPFAVKDNIDVAGWPTTAACPAFAYAPERDAGVVARLIAAGGIVIGKTNLDQFATGLVGTRSPFGAVPNVFNADYVSGGSSSGSASVVARGIVPFALGTDTAGSGRVPAGFNNIVGLKPTKGWLSTAGVVPACRTLDCVSVFALNVADALAVAEIAGAPDAADGYSRAMPERVPVTLGKQPRLAVPSRLSWFGDAQAAYAFELATHQLRELGATLVPIDFTPFEELAALLYRGPWVAERFVAVEDLLARDPAALNPVVRGIVEGADAYSAADAFKAEYRRAELARDIAAVLADVDALVVPTAPAIYTQADIAANPVELNSRLGTYTNFANLADLCALALPAGFRADELPAGITLLAPAWHDRALAEFGARWQTAQALPLGATGRPFATAPASTQPPPNHVRLAVVGAHLTGMPLNPQLTDRDAIFVERTRSAPTYRLYALANTQPPKPGLVKATSGQAIEVELWDVPVTAFGSFVALIPAPLGIGTLLLEDGREVKGFICEPWAIESARDISEFGGWRAYLASLSG